MTPPLTSRETPAPSVPLSKTLSALYAEVMQGNVLTPKEQETLRTNYAKILTAKRDEVLSDATHARRELQELLGGVSDSDAVLAKLDPFLPGAKTVEAVKAGVATVPEGVKAGVAQAQDALGNLPDAARKTAEGALAQGGKAIAVVDQAIKTGNVAQAGAELSKVADSWSGKITKAMDIVGAFFAWVFSLASGDSSKKWEEFLVKIGKGAVAGAAAGAAGTVAGAANGAAGAAASAAETARARVEEARNSPEKLTEKMLKAKEKYWDELKSRGWIRGDGADQRRAFEKLWADKAEIIKKGVTKLDDLVIEGKKGNIMSDIIEPSSTEALGFFLRLIGDGVIPKEALYTMIGDLTKKSLKLGLLSAEALITQTPGKTMALIGEFASTDIEKLRPDEKAVILASVHHNMSTMLTLAGKLSFAIGSVVLMPLYFDQGSGLARMKIFSNSAVADFDAAGKNLDEMLKMLGDIDPKSPTRSAFVSMREIIRDTQLKTFSTSVYLEMQKAGKLPAEIALEMEGMIQGVENKEHKLFGVSEESLKKFRVMLSDIRTGGGESKFMGYLKTPALLSRQNDISMILQRARSSAGWNPTEVRVSDAVRQSENVGNSLADIVRNKNSLSKIWTQANLGMKFEEFVASIDRGVLPIIAKDTNQARGIMERFIRALPAGADHFFSALTVSLTIAHVSASDEKLKTLGQDILLMNPFVGGYILIKEGLEVEDRVLTKSAYLVGGGAVWAIGAVQVSKILSTTGSVRMAAIADVTLGPIATFGRGTLALSRGISYSSILARNIARPGAGQPFIQGKAFASYLMVAAIAGYFAYTHTTEENEKKFLTEKGILKTDGTLDMAAVKQQFLSLPEDKRSKLLENILNGSLGDMGVVATIKKGGSEAVIHSENTGTRMSPVPLDLFQTIADAMKELGVGDGKTFLSVGATESTKKYIAQLQISAEQKQEFMRKFGITA